jgi:hypothetical protein
MIGYWSRTRTVVSQTKANIGILFSIVIQIPDFFSFASSTPLMPIHRQIISHLYYGEWRLYELTYKKELYQNILLSTSISLD